MKEFEEVYCTEVELDKFEVITINLENDTYSITYSTDFEVNEMDAVVMDPKTFNALKSGVKRNFSKIKK